MTEIKQPADINQESLKTLIRGITKFPGEFSLILANCNYGSLREKILQQLQKQCTVEIRELNLEPSIQSIYGTIAKEMNQEQPDAFMVFGLESVRELDQVLKATNQIREEFRNFAFPLVLWVTDELLKKLIRLVPDFYSWATTVEFVITTEELINFLQEAIDRVFAKVLASRQNIFVQEFESINFAEVQFASKELKNRGVKLEPEWEAGLEFVLGRLANNSQTKSRQHYERSLELCQQVNKLEECGHSLFFLGLWWRNHAERNRKVFESACDRSQDYFQQCIKVFEEANKPELVAQYINPYAEILHRRSQWKKLEEVATKALDLHQTYADKFKQARAKGFLAELALSKSDWSEAQKLANQALTLIDNGAKAITTPSPEQQVFLNWVNSFHRGWYLFSLAKAEKHLGQSKKAIAKGGATAITKGGAIAIATLVQARETIKPNDDPGLYIAILGELRDSYFQQGEYLTAFEIKQQRRAIESQFNFSAFIGAGRLQPKQQVTNAGLPISETEKTQVLEFAASGREQDIKRLVERMYRDDIKLTVIYGQSGVGKSSIIQAGLIPALKQKIIDTRRTLPILQRVYRDWIGELAKLLDPPNPLTKGEQQLQVSPHKGDLGGSQVPLDKGDLGGSQISPHKGDLGGSQISPHKGDLGGSQVPLEKGDLGGSIDLGRSILQQLQNNSEGNRLTVLIFDQFEEFFFDCQEPSQRKVFYQFLQQCLELPYVKVILSLREDYLHYLLECNRLTKLDAVNNNILDKNILYYLGNFTTDDAKSVIEGLTEHTQFSLKPNLVEQLVKDLAEEIGEVRPIELQVVGAQLQAENIKTLEQYQKSGTKEEMVKRYLDAVVKDCGKANEKIAQLILYLLTDANNTRPLKNKQELVKGLAGLNVETEEAQLDLVLTVLQGSGLVFMIPTQNADQYQLVHDYLAAFVRKQQEQGLVKELRETKEREQRTQARLNRFLRVAFASSIATILVLGVTTFVAIRASQKEAVQKKIAEEQAELAKKGEIEVLNSKSKNLILLTYDRLGALVASVKAGQKLEGIKNLPIEYRENLKNQIIDNLRLIVYDIQEFNRLEKHENWVYGVSFSPDGKTIATVGADNKIILLKENARLRRILKAHRSWVYDVSFSPDGETIATASRDKTVILWNRNGDMIKTLDHDDRVLDVSFSPDGETIATASWDKTVKLWNRNGDMIKTLHHDDQVNSVSFSPDGKMIATASDDYTAKIWKIDEDNKKPIITLKAHTDKVYSVSFSPDGKMIATASWDKTAKLWNLEKGTPELKEELKATLTGHTDRVFDVSFSPDGKMIATASWDRTVKLWNQDGSLLRTLKGHTDRILSVSFSPDANGDGKHDADFDAKIKIIATASADKTVKLWKLDDNLLPILQGHNDIVRNVSFKADGKIIATASEDGKVTLWDTKTGKVDKTLKKRDCDKKTGDCDKNNKVYSVSFSPKSETIIAVASNDGTVKLWEDDKISENWKGHEDPIYDITFSPDGEMIATASADETFKIWSLDGKELNMLENIDKEQHHSDNVVEVEFSPDGNMIVTASDDGTAKIWKREGKNYKLSVTTPKFENNENNKNGHKDEVNGVNFSPDGKMIATASDDKTIKLWNLDGKHLETIKGHEERVLSVKFSPDGKFLASASFDKTVKIWRLEGTGENVTVALYSTLRGHEDWIWDVSFSPDGEKIASVSSDKTVRLWSFESIEQQTSDLDQLLNLGCNWLRDYLSDRPDKLEELKACQKEFGM